MDADLDVPPVDPSQALDPNKDYVYIDNEANYHRRDLALQIAKDLLS